jgi:DNA-binding GntR family transcriptional regulator
MVREALPADASLETLATLDWNFFDSIMSSSHNTLLMNLHRTIRAPFLPNLLRASPSTVEIAAALPAQLELFKALNRRDSPAATRYAAQVVEITMLALEENAAPKAKPTRSGRKN